MSDHLDAEIVAAWMDGGLEPAALAAAEAHASTCERCQALLATTVRTLPVDPVPAENRSWFRIPLWGLPLAAGAAAVVIWMVVPSQQQLATTPPAAPPAVVRETPPPPAPVASAESTKEIAPTPLRDARVEQRRDQAQSAPGARVRENADAKLKRDAQDSISARNETIAAPPPATTAAAAPAATPAPAAAAPMLQRAERFAQAAEVVAPDGSRRWRFAEYGPDVTGGSAVSSTVCWLIGRGGLVMLSTNGTTFDHVNLPDRVDVISISAADARSAIVTTTDGRRFETADGGRSWRQIQA